MLNKLGLSDFRAYGGKHSIRFAPLTLLYGPNSAGKSSIIKLLQLIAESSYEVPGSPLKLDGKAFPAMEIGRLQSVYTSKSQIGIELEFQNEYGVVGCSYEILTTGRIPRVYQFGLSTRKQWLFTDVDGTGAYAVTVDGASIGVLPVHFNGLCPTLPRDLPQTDIVQELGGSFTHLAAHLSASIRSVVRLTADRVPFPSEFGFSQSHLGEHGAGVPSMLVADHGSGDLLEALNLWFRDSSGLELRLVDFATPNGDKRYSLFLEKQGSGKRVLVSDSGQGVAQVLPVLAACLLYKRAEFSDGSFLLVEHPELHLHTSLHHHVMSRFIDSFGGQDSPKHFAVVETHSESMLLEAQIAILEKRLQPHDVTLVWITEDPSGGSVMKQTALDLAGLPVDPTFPIEAFMGQAALAQRAFDLRVQHAGAGQ